MDGCISAPLDSKTSIESSAAAIKDWFRYEGRTFDIRCYEGPLNSRKFMYPGARQVERLECPTESGVLAPVTYTAGQG